MPVVEASASLCDGVRVSEEHREKPTWMSHWLHLYCDNSARVLCA